MQWKLADLTEIALGLAAWLVLTCIAFPIWLAGKAVRLLKTASEK